MSFTDEYDHDDAHAECFQPHGGTDLDYYGSEGRPL
ncbi:hypothetical protein FHR33_009001 [Nonomuraea dietziae]|jgi:hypothetical protein|uniref:Uncharacterized protein n=1 Tax=Nonomuraea dietziae TaxID=65515 RepID=A0A7W5VK39_9ACTN|nr:hypothetical protein [Nonomuraea dietziae]